MNVLKGNAPGLGQLDKTLPPAGTGIGRGSVLIEDAGTFRVSVAADANKGKIAYFSNGNQDDPDAKMANGVTGISCTQSLSIELDQFTGTPAVGSYMQVGDNGKLVAHADGKTAVFLVTKASFKRWSNAEPVPGKDRLGKQVSCIQGWTVFIPAKAIEA